jgi:hypothetical protein
MHKTMLENCRKRRVEGDYRRQLPRIFQLHDIAQAPQSQAAYFYDLVNRLNESPVRLKHFLDIERDLKGLDCCAWEHLKSKVTPLLKAPSVERGWQAVFDELNEAKGYNYLAQLGCGDVKFIPKGATQTPDVQGYRGVEEFLCEVKTINISQVEAERRMDGGVGTIQLHLPSGFFSKLKCDINKSTRQMVAFSGNRSTRKISYIIVNFDDNLHECADIYEGQIRAFIQNLEPKDVTIFLDIKPPFYSATAPRQKGAYLHASKHCSFVRFVTAWQRAKH